MGEEKDGTEEEGMGEVAWLRGEVKNGTKEEGIFVVGQTGIRGTLRSPRRPKKVLPFKGHPNHKVWNDVKLPVQKKVC